MWGKGAMDPEPGRCRKTDGKKWRCSKDVAVGHKYCDRYVHRGRNRSRKPVENHTHTPTAKANAALALATSNYNDNGNGGGGLFKLKTMPQIAAQPLTFIGGGSTNFIVSEPSNSSDLLHFNQSIDVIASTFEGQSGNLQ